MFAKSFETSLGQVVVLARQHDGRPAIIYHFDMEDDIELAPALIFPDTYDGEQKRNADFEEITLEIAEDFATTIANRMRAISFQK